MGSLCFPRWLIAAEDAGIDKINISEPVTVTYQSKNRQNIVKNYNEVKKGVTFDNLVDVKKLANFIKFDPTAQITVYAKVTDDSTVTSC